jgi:DNA repair protein RadA/Sms
VRNVALPLDLASFGEVGLTGQVRPVAHSAARLREAARFGMRRVLAAAPASLASGEIAGLSRVATVAEALGVLQ